MNRLYVGTDKKPFLTDTPVPFLFLDDGSLIDSLELPKQRTTIRFDVTEHCLNILKDITYKKAESFAETMFAAYPGGQGTLTKETAKIQILEALLSNPESLDTLVPDRKEFAYASIMVKRLLLSPVLNSVLTGRTNFRTTATILARLDRSELGDFDAFVLGNLLISVYNGQVVVPDFGFYGTRSHVSLIRQNRLIAGVNFLDESSLKDDLLLIETKEGHHCTYDDAVILAQLKGLKPDPNKVDNPYNNYIDECIGG